MKYIQVLVFVILICIGAIFFIPSVVIRDEEHKYARQEAIIDSFRVISDSARVQRERIEEEVVRLQNERPTKKIVYLKQKNNENIRFINSVTLTQLDSFFSARSYVEAN